MDLRAELLADRARLATLPDTPAAWRELAAIIRHVAGFVGATR